ncbi:hypothetical protein PL373_13505 [Tenacibaculum maritimum]|nr:hypothetical protein [Tenacibaculum maritimum]MDB0602146.1 hypothetical protein [Tenacibaculum maritimum]MDB0613821.1 hypothetical protein [Tenacibaculum maritimum]
MELANIKLDKKLLEQKANELAHKAAISELEKYYTNYDSPFKKLIRKQLETQTLDHKLTLPNIIALINDTLSSEITKLANLAVVNSYVPQVNEIITNQKKEIKFSEILKEYVSWSGDDIDDYSVEIEESEYGWLTISLSGGDEKCEFTLHNVNKNENKYHLLSMPRDRNQYGEKMTLKVADKSIEMPFTKNTLSDKFTMFLCSLILADSHIEMDTDQFDYDWFDKCHC